MPPERFEELPLGSGKKEAIPDLEIPVESVENEVIWVNPHMQVPFALEVGKETKLAIFAGREKGKGREKTAEAAIYHGRSLLVGQVIFKDEEGRMYRDVDIKGIGNIVTDDVHTSAEVEPTTHADIKGMLGIFERSIAEEEAAHAENFLKLGIRTYRVVAITKLKELMNDGKKYSIQSAKKKKIIPKDSEPVVSIRAFGTRGRIQDAGPPDWPEHSRLEDARKLVAQEIGAEASSFDKPEYFSWFLKTLAENLALMHKNHLVHGYLTQHNITLDCRIIDLDSVQSSNTNVTDTDMKNILDPVRIRRYKMYGTEEKREENLQPYRKDFLDARNALDLLRHTLIQSYENDPNFSEPKVPGGVSRKIKYDLLPRFSTLEEFEKKYLDALTTQVTVG